ncbi:hypothetical protein MexAM1_META1p4056 [Methylorubrum extorquens AM1]|uniref:Uncharacterized protein n=1 Tax=Methylorubrum extorquens (strain ATCC 14718 / DSM 1338 / JCM 2805 / NCIMB 9133 / AM1) TaxID=272630 RepID=C5B1B7_METEA|nr:hypothetical protein MexAM1_META1p4056 [Methylorubrum extorquens AM1]
MLRCVSVNKRSGGDATFGGDAS